MSKILDCTLRDGGYYTNWDFSSDIVQKYFHSFNNLPVEYLEIGYRSKPMNKYLGEYFYCPDYVLDSIKKISNKKLVIILDEKDVLKEDAVSLLEPCKGIVTMVRMAIDPQNFKRALGLAQEVKKMGFEVGFNVMYMSSWKENKDFLDLIGEVTGIADIFYMVDSYGGVFPEDVKSIYNLVKEKTTVPIGFHGHNNLEMGLINTLTAIECGAEMVDATVTGMGRGAGNLKTELLLTALNARDGLEVDFNSLSQVTDAFEELQMEYGWGTNLPYMVSGANSLPQKDVMEWVSKRYYSFNSIIRALHNQKENVKDNESLPLFKTEKKFSKALIIGGGPSTINHKKALRSFIEKTDDMCVIFASSKNAGVFADIEKDQYYSLVGNEGLRLSAVFDKIENFSGKCILPPYPRKMGTFIPEKVRNTSYELESVTFTDVVNDSHTVLALQTAIELGVKEIYVTGYDGYSNAKIGTKEQELFVENEALFKDIATFGINPVSLTPTRYKGLKANSVYAHII
ncbi:hypothetical protein GWA97_00665 [Flavobacterium sp. LaA7.5]|nr:hypothetical protein [Flavobacterium salilacus subsp. altitudinum]